MMLLKGPCTLAKIGREIAERRDFWVKNCVAWRFLGIENFLFFVVSLSDNASLNWFSSGLSTQF